MPPIPLRRHDPARCLVAGALASLLTTPAIAVDILPPAPTIIESDGAEVASPALPAETAAVVAKARAVAKIPPPAPFIIAADGTKVAPPAPKAETVPVTLLFGNAVLGQPDARLDLLGLRFVGIDGAALIQLLQEILVPEHIEQLRAMAGERTWLTLTDLERAGITAEYLPTELALRVFVPLELRLPMAIRLAARQPPIENVPLARPATTSAYMNVRAVDDYQSRDDGTGDDGRQPLVLTFDGAAAMLGMTLEGDATYTESALAPWQRGDVRLVKDFPDDRNRFILGDLNYATTGFQTFSEAGGISFARNFDLQPYNVSASTAQRSFTLERRSDVDVLINGRRVRTLELGPGRYDLRDLPLANGTNDIALRITDEVGRTEIIAFPFVFDTNLLAEGEHEYSYALGALSEDTKSSKRYDDHAPVLSMFHIVGVTDSLTLGGNLQAIERQRIFGLEARVGTLFGVFRTDVAVSHSSYAPADVAARLQYRYNEPQRPGVDRGRVLLANVAYRGASFTDLGTTEPSNPTAIDAAVSYGQRLFQDVTGSVGYSAQFDRNGDLESRSLDLTLGKPLAAGIYADLFVSRAHDIDGSETSFLVTLSWIPYDSPHRLTLQRDSVDRTSRLNWSYTPPDTIGHVQATLDAEKSIQGEDVRADLTYRDYRYELQLRNEETYGGTATGARRNTTLRFGTALAYADGHMAISRPISNSFVMVAPHPTLAGHDVELNGETRKPQAKADAFGPAVLPDVPAYYIHRITADVPDVPAGYDLGDQTFNVQPGYRSGTLIVIGTGATVVVEGTLVDAEGRLIDLQLGRMVPLDATDRAPTAFFTDAAGRFNVAGLAPGRYELRLDAASDVVATFEIPSGVSGMYPLGTVVFPFDTDSR